MKITNFILLAALLTASEREAAASGYNQAGDYWQWLTRRKESMICITEEERKENLLWSMDEHREWRRLREIDRLNAMVKAGEEAAAQLQAMGRYPEAWKDANEEE